MKSARADWAQTPESVKRLVRSFLGRTEQLERQYEELKPENARSARAGEAE